MFDSKSKIIKAGIYIAVGFFILLMVIAFGMPDFLTRMGKNENIVAVVNGEKIYRLDFLRFRDNMTRRDEKLNSKEAMNSLLDSMIMRKLLLQKADEINLQVTDDKVMKNIKNISVFKDKDGNFDKSVMDNYLSHSHLDLSVFFSNIKEELILGDLQGLIFTGLDVPPEDIDTDFSIEHSKFQIKYCFLSSTDLKARYKDKIAVTDEEINNELKKADEIKDPQTDRKRIKDKLEKQKLNEFKNEILKTINDLAQKKGRFDEAAAVLKGDVSTSAEFKISEPAKDSKSGKALYSISNSQVFKDSLLSLISGQTSGVIDAFDGLYVFTPLKNKLNTKKPSEEEYAGIENEIIYQKQNYLIFNRLLTSLRENSKIVKYLKFN